MTYLVSAVHRYMMCCKSINEQFVYIHCDDRTHKLECTSGNLCDETFLGPAELTPPTSSLNTPADLQTGLRSYKTGANSTYIYLV